ncbi:MAG TPA: peptide chain release factor N(5)-glutamine methyltransferase [Succinivibrionaceae bacterium]|nr:peptide chain release factor N(5)-glutamine methyltransferase [Succinivibrionaceae bacterium]
MNIAGALLFGRNELLKAGVESPALESRLLLSYLTGLSHSALIIHDDELLDEALLQRFKELLKKRATGYPVEYILEQKEFWGLKLKVTPDTLIPRADTETLVEQALNTDFSSVLDLGTGSGAVILAIKKERPKAQCFACDLNEGALEVAKFNAANLGLLVEFSKSSWFEAYKGRSFDLIVSNPPYIEDGDEHLKHSSLPFEPLCALTSGKDGLDDIRIIIKGAREHLNKHGILMLEHGYNQAFEVRKLLSENGFVNVGTVRDLGGNERVSKCTCF